MLWVPRDGPARPDACIGDPPVTKVSNLPFLALIASIIAFGVAVPAAVLLTL